MLKCFLNRNSTASVPKPKELDFLFSPLNFWSQVDIRTAFLSHYYHMDGDNLARQADEIEALASIYGDEWCVLSASERVYCIQVGDQPDNPKFKITLQVILPPEYPDTSPPQYQLNSVHLRGELRFKLSNALEEIYCENAGESIIFLWVENIREFLVDHISELSSAVDEKYCSEETEDSLVGDDDSFDAEALADLLAKEASIHNKEDLTNSCEGKMEMPVIHHSEPLLDRRSTFQAHLAAVHSREQVQMVMDSLLENKKIAAATHNIQAYRIMLDKNGRQIPLHGCEDDGEHTASSRMLHLLQIIDAKNVLVVVTRWYGGVHLGPDRFKHINGMTRQMLEQHGYINPNKVSKKGPKSRKSGGK